MMNRNTVIGVIALVLVGAGLWWSASQKKEESPPPAPRIVNGVKIPAGSSLVVPPPAPKTAPASPSGSPASPVPVATMTPAPKPPVAEEPAAEPPKPIGDRKKFKDEMQSISFMLRDYRTLMDGNPVGSNAEIMKAIMGGNSKHARLGPPEGQKLNENGELVDRWGTPYFFHQQSATEMEIHSAGPDKIMWTTDDIVIR